MRFLLFGTGDYYNRFKKWFAQHEVLALLDNSVQKQYTEIDGLSVLPPKEGPVQVPPLARKPVSENPILFLNPLLLLPYSFSIYYFLPSN